MSISRSYDVVVWGATGFAGKLVAEHLARSYRGAVRWAVAGRSRERLQAVLDELAAKYGAEVSSTPVLIGDLADSTSLEAIARDTRVVLSTAGPYSLHGTPIVAAALAGGAHYVDITGEASWVKTLIEKFHDEAAAKGVRLVPCCGYDSLPHDLGVYAAVQGAEKAFPGKAVSRVTEALVSATFQPSGGTIATVLELAATAGQRPVQEEQDVYLLCRKPGQASADLPRGPDTLVPGAIYSPAFGAWLSPFMMQVCDARIVHRSNWLLGYGPGAVPGERSGDFRYADCELRGSWLAAHARAAMLGLLDAARHQTWMHSLIRRIAPAPGEGPSRVTMEGGHFHHAFIAEVEGADAGGEPARVRTDIRCDWGDPGYWGTARMVLEAALTLALQSAELDAHPQTVKGGLLTPASAMGDVLIKRLNAADIVFETKTL